MSAKAIEEGIQYHEQADQLLVMLQAYAPTGTEQAVVARVFNEMMADGNEPDQMVAMLANALVDGLRYGNWPWTTTLTVTAKAGHCKECDEYLARKANGTL